jgi:protocatechuate 3,4-dioxygenase beta subunit
MHRHDHGLIHDLEQLAAAALKRRAALGWLAAGSLLPVIGCGGGGDGGSSGTTTTTTTTTPTTTTPTSASCTTIPEETAGPYPGDGSNSSSSGIANALALSGIVRSDIRSSIAGASGTASGVPLTVTLQLVNSSGACAGLAGYAIYLWHCDALGRYSMYSSGVTGENYLRGVQETDTNGQAVFTTIFPGCYSGRWPHMHFEVYRSLTTATSWTNKLRTSQLALPESDCIEVYTHASGYSGSLTNLGRISLAGDNIFNDGVDTQLASVSGSVAAGYAATLEVAIAV